MKTNNNKRFSRKHDRKVLVAEESTKSWADSDSDTSSSSSSSSESEQEEVHCFMADQTDEDEVFDFSNVEFTRDDLVIALNDMVKEYRKLTHSFEEVKAENNSLKSSSAESSSDEQEDADTLKTELSKLQAENEILRNEISELKAEVAKSTVELSTWNKANITLQKICEKQKQASDKTGIGFSDSEFCKGESSTQSRPAYDNIQELMVEKDPVRGNPAKEHFFLICADIDLLVNLRARFIDEVASFFRSFSLRKLSSINFDDMYSKEEQVLHWGETESPQIAIQRKFYILLKYRTVLVWKFLDAWRINFAPGQGSTAVDIQVIELLSALHFSLLEELAKEARSLCLTWTKPCCSLVFEGSPRDRGAVLARSNSNTRSSCWIRTMILVNGVWTVEPCADRWVKIPRKVVSTEIPRQRQYDDTLPTMSVFFKLLRKRWSDVCLEVVDFSAKMRLLPLGSVQFCSSAQLAAPVFSSIPSRPTVFELRVSQFCSFFVDMSLFNRISRAEISEFLSAIALEKTVLRGVQSFEDSFSVSPRVQLGLTQQQSFSSSSSSSSLHFDKTDIDATASSRLHISPDLSAMFADFQATLSEQLFESDSNISSKLHKIEQHVRDSLSDQAAVFKSLSQEARQESRTLDDVQTIRFNEFRKKVLEKNASIFVGLADVRKEVDAIHAKVDIMASRLNDIQKEAEATKEAHSHQLLEFQSQAQENHTVIHAQLSSAVTPSFEQRVKMDSAATCQTVINADAANRERQEAAERDRERRRKEAQSLKRRRRD
ncbi:hypothetical protein F511_42415 [Dorcoceras hygrometricum]|uniref:Uncharacterized protein n=1 Tax=Dorcoceras hygrometricum TaxID=472368 RepID=A0A2Z7D0J7_9LAMI|nr:hypothetical protein F511_42415 [Dorcoceras hygrometricum]